MTTTEKKKKNISRTIKLFCPSVSKLVPWVTMEEQKLDLGSIARTFEIEPSTLKLNGHFISRGIDLISSSVTWKSLLSFFASRGLSTGTDNHDALIIDGNLSKPGAKRARSPLDLGSRDHRTSDCNGLSINTKPQVEDVNLFKKIKINESNPGIHQLSDGEKIRGHEDIKYNGLGVKRKPSMEDDNPLKKIKMKESNSGNEANFPVSRTIPSVPFARNCLSGSLKRLRLDEMIMTAPSKRNR